MKKRQNNRLHGKQSKLPEIKYFIKDFEPKKLEMKIEKFCISKPLFI